MWVDSLFFVKKIAPNRLHFTVLICLTDLQFTPCEYNVLWLLTAASLLQQTTKSCMHFGRRW